MTLPSFIWETVSRSTGAAGVFDQPQAVEVPVDNNDLGPEAARHPCCTGPHDPGPEYDHASWPHPGGATEQYAASSERALQVMGTYLGREAACYLAHRRQHG